MRVSSADLPTLRRRLCTHARTLSVTVSAAVEALARRFLSSFSMPASSDENYGAGSAEARHFHETVYHLVTQIPRGRVTTYGHLAYLAGKDGNFRQVGYALKHLPRNEHLKYNSTVVPWWRVVGAQGRVTTVERKDAQIAHLRDEIPITDTGYMDFSVCGWFPSIDDVNYDF